MCLTSGVYIRLMQIVRCYYNVITIVYTNSIVACRAHVAHIGSMEMFEASTATPSSADRSPAAVRRSALVPRLRGVNGNSLGSRRYREVAMALADDCGGADALDEQTRVLIRQVAGLTVEGENLQRLIARGEAVNHEDLVRIGNVLNRLFARLDRRRKALKPNAPRSALAAHFEVAP
jgi:hypothetical protein